MKNSDLLFKFWGALPFPALGTVALVALLSEGCSDPFESCETRRTCPVGGAGGATGGNHAGGVGGAFKAAGGNSWGEAGASVDGGAAGSSSAESATGGHVSASAGGQSAVGVSAGEGGESEGGNAGSSFGPRTEEAQTEEARTEEVRTEEAPLAGHSVSGECRLGQFVATVSAKTQKPATTAMTPRVTGVTQVARSR